MSITTAPSPETPAAEPPPSLLDKLAVAIPVAMTAIATVFAGLSSGELQKAMFWRTAAGQDQARATNQWTFAGLKRNRSLIMEGTAAGLLAGGVALPDFLALASGDDEKEAARWLAGKDEKGKELPPRVDFPRPDEKTRAVLDAIRDRKPEEEILKMASQVKPAEINAAIDAAADFIATTDRKWDSPVKKAGVLVKKAKASDAAAAKAAWFAMEQRRYRAESFMEQQLGFLYDARVHVVTAVSDKHRQRSQNFFYAMLAGQIGAVVATLALSRKTSTTLWLLAGLLGVSALGYGGFVHLAF